MLPDRSVLIGQKLVKNAKIEKFKCDILGDFQTMCSVIIPSSHIIFRSLYDPKNFLNCYRLLIYMAVIDTLLIIFCVTEFSIFNIFWGDWPPQWFIIAFPYWLHPLKVSKHAKLTQTFLYRVAKKVWFNY